MEYAFTNNWIIGAEYLYYDLGSRHLNIVPNVAASDFFGATVFSQTKISFTGSSRPRPPQLQVLIPDRRFRNNGGKAYAFPLFCGGLRVQGLGLPGRSREPYASRGSPSIWIAHYRAVWQLPSVNQRERIIKGMRWPDCRNDDRRARLGAS